MTLPPARFDRELLTVDCMLHIYCKGNHGQKAVLCGQCAALLEEAQTRLRHCPHGAAKPTCAKCPVHCYGPAPREQMRQVMRYAGPRMFYHHPWLAIRHLIDGWDHRRSVESMRHFYNRFHRVYGAVEWHLGPKMDQVVQQQIAPLASAPKGTAVEYACGSGLWTGKIAPYFAQVTAIDQAEGMLQRAQKRLQQFPQVQFRMGNILKMDLEEQSVDYAFVSFALHLFSAEDRLRILKQLLRIARQGVCIVDHSRKWDALTAAVEWWEGSHYDGFIADDFVQVAQRLHCSSWSDQEIATCRVLWFYP